MTENADNHIEAMGKLLSLTQKGKIEWRSVDPVAIKNKSDEDLIAYVFVSKYKENHLRIYQRKYKSTPRAFGLSVAAALALDVKSSEPSWRSEVVLELINNAGMPLWQFPREPILSDLLEAIRYKVSGAHDVITSLLQED